MSVYFCDTSALAKRYLTEIGSTWLVSTINPQNGSRVYMAHITIVEIVSAITRKEKGNHLSANDAQIAITTFEQDYNQEISIVPLTTTLVDDAKNLARKYALRGYDAVQLATALQTNQKRLSAGLSTLTFLSADNNLNNAAIAEGLLVDNPNNHP